MVGGENRDSREAGTAVERAAAANAARQALETLCHLFFQHTSSSATPLPAHFSRLVVGLLPRVTATQRSEFARRVAHSEALPRDIAFALAHDFVEVAGPVLRQSPALDEEVLMAAASGADAERARCVASRTNLPPEVTLALARRHDPAIAEGMLSGPARPIDAPVAELLAETPGLSPAAAERLVIWGELPLPALARLFWLVGSRTRWLIVERAVRRSPGGSGMSAATPSAANRGLGTALFAAAASRRWPDLVSLLGSALAVPRSLAQKIADDPTGEAMVVACRAAGVGVSQLTSLLVLMPLTEARPSHQSHLRHLVALGEHLPVTVAGDFLGLWRTPGQARLPQHLPAAVEAQRVTATPAARPGARGRADFETGARTGGRR